MSEERLHEYKEGGAGACAECGNSPVNHHLMYAVQTIAVWLAQFAYSFLRPTHARLGRAGTALFWSAESFMHALAAKVGITVFAHDPNDARTYRSQVIWEEATRRGIPMEQLVIFGRKADIYRARLGRHWEYFESLPIPRGMGSGGREWMDDKYLLKQALARNGIPVPRNATTTSVQAALRAFDAFGAPVVVKPRMGSRGRHTTVNVTNKAELERAFVSARQLCRYVVVEEYLPGGVCRGTVVGGKLAGFFQAEPPIVQGDGHSSVRELVAQKNSLREERVEEVALTDEHERFISRFGHSLDSVLPVGAMLPLTHRTGRLFGGCTRELLGAVHPRLRAYLERAADILGAPVVGFDLIIEKPEQDPDAQRWGFIEANSLPYIDLHYLPLEGTPSNVAAAVWDLWGDAARGKETGNA